jgi:cell division protein FtsW
MGTPHLLAATAVLGAVGPALVYSASAVRSQLTFGSSGVYLWRQVQGLVLGGIALYGLSRVPLVWLQRTGVVVWALATLLLAATLTPLGVEQHGAQRWLAIGPLVLQPLELVKLGLVLALAQWFAVIENRVQDFRFGVIAPLLAVGIPAWILLAQPDFGGAILLCLFGGVLLFVAGARPSHLAAVGLFVAPILIFAAIGADYRIARLESFLDPFAQAQGRGYQLTQSLLAFGAGGVFGAGIGAGQQKLGYLPEAHTDFILSVVGEEMGLIGVTAILATLGLFGLACVAIATRAKSRFGLLLASGAGLLVWLQGLVNAAVAMGLLPTTGTTLPFLSYGRSSLITSLAAVGLVLNVARPSKSGRSGWR